MRRLDGTDLGQYHIIHPLGQGGMSEVYLARQTSLARLVAIKVLPEALAAEPGFAQRFAREAHAIALLDHPNILPIYDFGEVHGLAYLVMPYLQGGTLKDIIRRGPLSPDDIKQYMQQMAGALGHAHRAGLVHRDVKPANMLVAADGRLLLADFGLVRIMEEAAPSNLSRNAILGTPEYMAPEQSQGAPVDGRADVYALGIVLFEMLTGRVPFRAGTPLATVLQHIHQPLPSPRALNPAIPPDVEQVVRKATAKRPEDRYGTPEELAAALARAMWSTQPTAPMTAFAGGNAPAMPFTPPAGGARLAATMAPTMPFPLPNTAPTLVQPLPKMAAFLAPAGRKRRAFPRLLAVGAGLALLAAVVTGGLLNARQPGSLLANTPTHTPVPRPTHRVVVLPTATPRPPTSTPVPPTATASPTATAASYNVHLVFGHGVDQHNGKVHGRASTFPADAPAIYAKVTYANVTAPIQVVDHWVNMDTQMDIHDDQITIQPGPTWYAAYVQQPLFGWVPGHYEVQVLFNGAQMGVGDFVIQSGG